MATLTEKPISLAEARRLAGEYDTVLLRATREADLETPIGAFLALDDGTPAYLLESVEGGERLGPLLLPGHPAAPPARSTRRQGHRAVASGGRRARDRADGRGDSGHRSSRGAATLHAATPRGAAPGPAALQWRSRWDVAYDAINAFEPTVPLPASDPVRSPLAAFLETDLVIVFDHLAHTLSAIAALHSDAPDFDARYQIAERAVPRGAGADIAGAAPTVSGHVPIKWQLPAAEQNLGRDAYIAASSRPRPHIAGDIIQVVLGRRQSSSAAGQIEGLDLYRALRRVAQPVPLLRSYA